MIERYSQLTTNKLVSNIANRILDFYNEAPGEFHWKKLYHCSAEYCIIGKLYILRSYNTIISVFDVENKMYYDFLRYVYGYTATSCQHLSKFRNLVILDNINELTYNNYSMLTWRPVL